MAETTRFDVIPATTDTCWPWQGVRSRAGGIVNALFQVPDQMVFGIAGTSFQALTLQNNATPTAIAAINTYVPVNGNNAFVGGNYLNPPNDFALNINGNLTAQVAGTITNTTAGVLNVVVYYSASVVSTTNVQGDSFNMGVSLNGAVPPPAATQLGVTPLPVAGSSPAVVNKTCLVTIAAGGTANLCIANTVGIRQVVVYNAQLLVQRQIG